MLPQMKMSDLDSVLEVYPTWSNPNLRPVESPQSPESPALIRRAPTKLVRKKPPGPEPQAPLKLTPTAPVQLLPTAVKLDELPSAYWKFHVMRFGSNLYLTTNPTLQHLHCRNAPGYFVSVTGSKLDYTMSFEDLETGQEILRVRKVSTKEGTSFRYKLRLRPAMQGRAQAGKGRNSEEARPGEAEDTKARAKEWDAETRDTETRDTETRGTEPRDAMTRENEAAQKEGGDDNRRPVEKDTKGVDGVLQGTLRRRPVPQLLLPVPPVVPMSNYETQVGAKSWNIGSVPRTRESHFSPGELRYVGKYNVYFHDCFSDLARYHHWAVPPAQAVFRPCEAGAKKRVLRRIHRLRAKPDTPTKEGPYVEIKSYAAAGDGLYFDTAPADDDPDHVHKLGWVTVYEDEALLSKPGMFDAVVGLTTAVGYDQSL